MTDYALVALCAAQLAASGGRNVQAAVDLAVRLVAEAKDRCLALAESDFPDQTVRPPARPPARKEKAR